MSAPLVAAVLVAAALAVGVASGPAVEALVALPAVPVGHPGVRVVRRVVPVRKARRLLARVLRAAVLVVRRVLPVAPPVVPVVVPVVPAVVRAVPVAVPAVLVARAVVPVRPRVQLRRRRLPSPPRLGPQAAARRSPDGRPPARGGDPATRRRCFIRDDVTRVPVCKRGSGWSRCPTGKLRLTPNAHPTARPMTAPGARPRLQCHASLAF